MQTQTKVSIVEYFSLVEDPRVQGRCLHKLVDILAIAVCARICGAEDFEEMEEFGIQREEWLRGFLELKNGIPSHDTIRRTLSIVDPNILEIAFREWTADFRSSQMNMKDSGSDAKRISIDGKSVNGTYRGFNDPIRPLILVNVFDHEQGICLGQSEAPSTGNAETKSAVELIDWLDIEGTLVSVDAGLGRKSFLNRVLEKKADYVVPVKSNAKASFEELGELAEKAQKRSSNWDYARKIESGHGRDEDRECFVSTTLVSGLSEKFHSSFPGVKSIIKVTRTREVPDRRYIVQKTGSDGKQSYHKNLAEKKVSTETILFVSSLPLTAESALREIRTHWGIENKLHWSLDVIFNEDQCRVRDKTTAANLAMLRKMAFNLLQACPDKGSKRRKMKRASWNLEYLADLILRQA